MRDIVKRQVDFTPGAPKFYYEIFGLSDETKPTEDVATGSFFTEQDTGIMYSYNETAETWYPTINLGGGS